MNLVKWLRKNNRKVMAIVVVLIMISFVLGAGLSQLAKNMGNRGDNAIFTYGDAGEITHNMQVQAEMELKFLEAMIPYQLLRINRQTGQVQQQDISQLLLCQMLFPDVARNVNLHQAIKTLARKNELSVSELDIDKFFIQSGENAPLNWLLLKAEAEKYGVTFLPEAIKQNLERSGQIHEFNKLAQSYKFTNELAYKIRADFEAVNLTLIYMCSGDISTISQIQNIISTQRETFDYEYVQIKADSFVDQINEPSQEEITAQFNKYKDLYENSFSSENIFGFGYKQPGKVKLEYILVDVEDIKNTVPDVTEEEAEQFYQQNLSLLTRQVPKNPEDPNSEIITETMKYSQAANMIKRQIKNTKVSAKAEEIIDSIKDTANAAFDDIDFKNASIDEIKAKAQDYSEIVELAKKKFGVEIEAGETSFVSDVELGLNSTLGKMAIVESQKSPVALIRLLYSIEELSDVEFYNTAKPKLYENIGMLQDQYNSKVGIVRIIDVSQPTVVSIDTEVEIRMPLLEGSEIKSYTTKEKVIEDIKLVKAYELARAKADKFVKDASKDFDAAIKSYNSELATDANSVELKLEEQKDLTRVTALGVQAAKTFSQGQSTSDSYGEQVAIFKDLLNKIYNLNDNNLPAVVDMKSDASVYIIKSVSQNKMNIDEYTEAKNQAAMIIDSLATQSGSLTYLMPENLKARMNFEIVREKEDEDANSVDAK